MLLLTARVQSTSTTATSRACHSAFEARSFSSNKRVKPVRAAPAQADVTSGSIPPTSYNNDAMISPSAVSQRPKRRLPLRKLIFPLALASAVTSLAIHLRSSKDDVKQLERRHEAQLSVLNSLVSRIKAGQMLSEAQIMTEYERVGLAERSQHTQPSEKLGWKEMLFGRARTAEQIRYDAEETKRLEEGQSCLQACTTSLRQS
ncbi:hypothetical protein EMMF5_000430 [Cystobasidiomycetes sp. EMM_F5]